MIEDGSFSYAFIDMVNPYNLQQVIDEFLDAKRAERLSPATLSDYCVTMKRFSAFMGNVDFAEIKPSDIRAFLAALEGLSKKTVKNYWIGLSSLWTWAQREGYCESHIVRMVRPPKPEQVAVDPLSETDIRQLLRVNGMQAARNHAVIYILLDSGLRASELANLNLDDISNNRLRVMGKGSKERFVPLSRRTWEAVHDYLRERPRAKCNALIVSDRYDRMTRSGILQMVKRMAREARVENVYPHRFRHTFAINYLRNGGDPYTLQQILGHSTMEMVKRYLNLAEHDIKIAHARASPVMKWEL